MLIVTVVGYESKHSLMQSHPVITMLYYSQQLNARRGSSTSSICYCDTTISSAFWLATDVGTRTLVLLLGSLKVLLCLTSSRHVR